MALVVIDAGHGGANPGAVYGGRREKDDVLALSMEVGNILERNGVDVYYTRTSDVYESPAQKTEEANAVRGDYFVSIHRNSSPYPNQYTGVESLVYNRYGEAARLAENINARLEELGFANQGVNERKDLVVLSGSQMPAVLTEVGFINSDSDNRLFDERFNDIAKAIADGILATVWSSCGVAPETGRGKWSGGGLSFWGWRRFSWESPDPGGLMGRDRRSLRGPYGWQAALLWRSWQAHWQRRSWKSTPE